MTCQSQWGGGQEDEASLGTVVQSSDVEIRMFLARRNAVTNLHIIGCLKLSTECKQTLYLDSVNFFAKRREAEKSQCFLVPVKDLIPL